MVAQMIKNPSAMRETWVRSLGGEDPLEEDMAIHSIQYSCFENLMDRGAWWAAVLGGHKESDTNEATKHSRTRGHKQQLRGFHKRKRNMVLKEFRTCHPKTCHCMMLLNCGVGEDSGESLGLQGDPTSPF